MGRVSFPYFEDGFYAATPLGVLNYDINLEQNMKKSRFIVANITWNRHGWRQIDVNKKAGARPVQTVPGNESLNFEFSKEGLGDETHVFGFSKWQGRPRGFEEPGIIFFFTRNLEKKRGEIVGVYGNAKILKSERHTKWENLKRVTGIRQ